MNMNYTNTTSSGSIPTNKGLPKEEPKTFIDGNGWNFGASLDKMKDLVIEIDDGEHCSIATIIKLNKPTKKQLETLGTLFNALANNK